MNTTKKTVRVHNLLLLDESGSMESIYSAALSGANESIQAIRKAQEIYPEQEHLFSFVTFSTELDCFESRASIKTVFDDVPIGDIHDLTVELSRFSLNGIKLNAFVCLFGFKPYKE